jgi:hypothetical protein
MEALCILWTLGMVFFAVRFAREGTNGNAVGMTITFVLACFTNERFMAAAPFLVAPVIVSNSRQVRTRAALALLLVSPLALNVIAKKLVLRMPFFVGTGGTTIGFNPLQIASFWRDGLLNVFGISRGPAYLMMVDPHDMPALNQALGIAFALAALAVMALFIHRRWKTGLWMTAWFGLLIAGLLFSASVTIRQEARWLYAPYLVALLFWSYAAARGSRPVAAGIAFAALAIAGTSNDAFFRSRRDGIYFMTGQAIAQSFYEQSLQRYGWAGREFYVTPFEHSEWYFPPHFFDQFLAGRSVPVRDFDDAAAMTWSQERFDRARIFAPVGNAPAVVEVTDLYRQRAFMRTHHLVSSLVDGLGAAKILGQRLSSDLPNGAQVSAGDFGGTRGILALPDSAIDFELGPVNEPSPGLAISIGFNPVAVGWNVSDGVLGRISFIPSGGPEQQLWEGEVLPTDPARFLSFPLDACEKAPCHVILRTGNQPGHHTLGDWPVWFAPSVVAANASRSSTP